MAFALKEGDSFENEEQREVFERAINRCNNCRYSCFAARVCIYDPKNPLPLNTFETARGYIYLLKPWPCPRLEERKRKEVAENES